MERSEMRYRIEIESLFDLVHKIHEINGVLVIF